MKREATLADAAHELAPFVVFGDYELLEEIGHGGMGVVWRAHQRSVDRVVALKFLQAGLFAAEEARERFRREGRAAAALRHPNIVAIHGVGEYSGRPFFSMDYIPGHNLAVALRENLPSSRQAATWALALAEALAHAHAHQQGIIHRDLKPANILLDEANVPHLTDFGLARVLGDSAELTLTGTALGTAAYMAPEQAAGRSDEIGRHTDIHALGAVLYHTLTGRPPFLADSIPATLKQVVENDPVAPHHLNPAVPRDLETICLKCLEKVPASRFALATELAAELRRFLADQPILTRPRSRPERLWRACRRHPVVALLSLALGVAIVAGVSGILWQWGQTRAANRQLHTLVSDTKVQLGEALLAQDDSPRALVSLAEALRVAPDKRLAANRLVAALTQRDFPLPAAPPLTNRAEIADLAFSPDGHLLATASREGELQVIETATGRLELDLQLTASELIAVQFSPDGQSLAVAEDRMVRLLRTDDGSAKHLLPHASAVMALEFSGDGTTLLSAATDVVGLWNLTAAPPTVAWLRGVGTNCHARLSPDGRWLVTAARANATLIWNVRQPTEPPATLDQPASAWWAQFTPDGQRLLILDTNSTLRIWTNSGGWKLARAIPITNALKRVELSPDGRFLAACSGTALTAASVDVLDFATGGWLPVRLPFSDDVTALCFSPDSRRLFAASSDGRARLWSLPEGRAATEPLAHNWHVVAARFSPDGTRLATAAADGTVRLWDVRPGAAQPVRVHHGGDVRAVAFSPDGRLVASGGGDARVRLWRPETGQDAVPPLPHEHRIMAVEFSDDGRRLLTVAEEPTVRVWEPQTGRLLSRFQHTNEVQAARLAPSGRLVASSGKSEDHFQVWDAATGQPLWSKERHPASSWAASFSPDSKYLATGDYDGVLYLWHAQDGQLRLKLAAHSGPIATVVVSPDNARLLSASWDQQVILWDVRTGQPAAPVFVHADVVRTAALSPAGDRVATGCMVDHTAHLWDTRTGQRATPPMQHEGWLSGVNFSPDGASLATASHDGTARFWDVRTGLSLAEPLQHGNRVWTARFSPDGRSLATGSRDGDAWVWFAPCLSLPAPEWLPTLAEALAGTLFHPTDQFEPRSFKELLRLRAELSARPPRDDWTHWAHWFFADRASRPAQPAPAPAKL